MGDYCDEDQRGEDCGWGGGGVDVGDVFGVGVGEGVGVDEGFLVVEGNVEEEELVLGGYKIVVVDRKGGDYYCLLEGSLRGSS